MNTNVENIKDGMQEIEEAQIVDVAPQEETTDVIELKSTALAHFKEEDQKAIIELAGSIDVNQFEKIMSYGSIPLVRIFEQSGKILKEFQGTSADQEVITLVRELAKKANESQEEFNLVLQEPNFFEKTLQKIFIKIKERNDADAKVKAISCYKLLEQLRDSCDSWLQSLTDTRLKIIDSAYSDRDTCYEIEEYIVAGRIAEERIENEMLALKDEYEQTGLTDAKMRYENCKRGLENLKVRLVNLEKSRAANILAITELALQVRTNENVSQAVTSQKENSLAVAAQQLRNALFDMKNREALEGQKSITKLNDELMKKVADGVAVTAEESESILLNGVYTPEAAVVALETVKKGCNAILQARNELMPKIEAEMEKVQKLLDEVDPVVKQIKENVNGDGISQALNTPSKSSSTSGLTF